MNTVDTTDGLAPADGQARQIVLAALRALRPLLPPGAEIAEASTAPLALPDGPLDSLGVVNLVVAVEDSARALAGQETGLLHALGLPLEESPFRTVGTLVDWVGAHAASGG